jgi:hypothetical protein
MDGRAYAGAIRSASRRSYRPDATPGTDKKSSDGNKAYRLHIDPSCRSFLQIGNYLLVDVRSWASINFPLVSNSQVRYRGQHAYKREAASVAGERDGSNIDHAHDYVYRSGYLSQSRPRRWCIRGRTTDWNCRRHCRYGCGSRRQVF